MNIAIQSMKKGKAAGCSGLPIDLIKHLGKSGAEMLHEIMKRGWEEWETSMIVPIYRQKGSTTRDLDLVQGKVQ